MLYEWAKQWNVSPHAVNDLIARVAPGEPDVTDGLSEAAVQNRVRVKACTMDMRLWRNNNGAATDARGRLIRYGLANDSKKVQSVLKSSDLVGIRKVLITPQMVGKYLGQLTAIECKPNGWVFTGTKRETAQLNFLLLVMAFGGCGSFISDEKDMEAL